MREDSANDIILIRHIDAPIFGAFFVPGNWQFRLTNHHKFANHIAPKGEYMQKFMNLALELAGQFKGKTSPNPAVGAVVVKDGEIVGRGAHPKAGLPHAEVYTLNEAGSKAKDATIYVTLEPCSHFGKTPPCTQKIIDSGISKVVIARQDPNPLVAGKGIAKLRENGIEVVTGICETEAKLLNEDFEKFITTQTPFVTMKAAISLDGKIATSTGHSHWISNQKSRQKVHQLRAEHDAILVGKNTLLNDNPSLNVRLETEEEGPQKIVIIPKLDIPLGQIKEMNVYHKSITKPLIIVCHNSSITSEQERLFKDSRIELLGLGGELDDLDFSELLVKLGKRKIMSLLVEGGSSVYSGFLKQRLVDKIHLFQAPILVGNDGIPILRKQNIQTIPDALKLENIKTEMLDDNLHIWGYPVMIMVKEEQCSPEL